MSVNLTAEELQGKIGSIERVPPVSAEEQGAVRRNTAFALPNSPVSHGLRAEDVKKFFWRGLVGESEADADNAVYFLNRLAEKMNVDIDVLREVLAQIVTTVFEEKGKLATLTSDVKELGSDALSEIQTRAAEDAALGKRIDNEEAARKAADAALDGRTGALEKIGDASCENRGYMTPAQVQELATLAALLQSDDANTTIDTIAEVLKAFENVPEGTNVANMFVELRGLIQSEAEARESADAALDERVAALEKEMEKVKYGSSIYIEGDMHNRSTAAGALYYGNFNDDSGMIQFYVGYSLYEGGDMTDMGSFSNYFDDRNKLNGYYRIEPNDICYLVPAGSAEYCIKIIMSDVGWYDETGFFLNGEPILNGETYYMDNIGAAFITLG